MYFKGKRSNISNKRTSVLCLSLLPANNWNLQCSCQNPQHNTSESSGEGVCTSLWQTCYIGTCVQRNTHQGSVLCPRREGSLQQDSKFFWKWMSGNNVQTRDQTGLLHILPRKQRLSHSALGEGLEYPWPLHSNYLWGTYVLLEGCPNQNFSSWVRAVAYLISALCTEQSSWGKKHSEAMLWGCHVIFSSVLISFYI